MTTSLQRLIRDPEGNVSDPATLVEREDLTNEEKLRVLESWRADLLELQKAVEENMASVDGAPGHAAARLAQVMEAIDEIGSRTAGS